MDQPPLSAAQARMARAALRLTMSEVAAHGRRFSEHDLLV